ncbi:MAG: hypothetical protein A2365_00780 [Candidatus Nealsonbacteria bacterium RIFOXYB1_FULL_40_15]|uniref:Thymidylate synthase/dCMP hydroxymethylase domain-containing protein n=2 Tax=Candidatus Nealsoniibacteriota TaxID=1817911 RepID=A0A1G2EN39_9BACT|nr:MAG: hypothetical protein A2365_00780 [Candidatus Nealsonbacteria bacterium RIFOXYB1_FULL_40_15]OGZ28546.1 MAG: hypothetical protein A2562_03470 [Candidatus Nealsonbacteria bacterium RIFOXYD1_FULL_39_11]
MYIKIEPFGFNVYGETIGSTWLSLVEAIIKNGDLDNDEGRKRLCLQNVRIHSETQNLPDKIIDKLGIKKNIDAIVHLTFDKEIMHDFDVVPSFSPGSKSYYARMKEGKMIEYVVERLSNIPESKKAIISFIHWDDYKAVLAKPKDDYLPCITTVQFRLIKNKKGWKMNTIFNARSIDAFQKASGNLVAIVLLSKKIAKQIAKNLKVPVDLNTLDGIITDAHIYQETINDAKELVNKYKNICN